MATIEHHHHPSFESTVVEVFEPICKYLHPLEVLRLSNTTHYLRHSDGLSIRLILHVGLFNGTNNTKTTIEHIHEGIINKSIHMPNEIRLLNLINIRNCEVCKSKSRRIKFCSRFGIGFCGACRSKLTIQKETVLPRRMISSVEEHELLRFQEVLHDAFYMLERPAFKPDENPIGPIITNRDLSELTSLKNCIVAKNAITSKVNSAYSARDNERRGQYIAAVSELRYKSYIAKSHRKGLARARVQMFRKRKLEAVTRAYTQVRAMIPHELDHVMIHECDDKYPYYLHPRYQPSYPFRRGKCLCIFNLRTRMIVKPLLQAPSKYRSHQKRLQIAKQICREFHAIKNEDSKATQIDT